MSNEYTQPNMKELFAKRLRISLFGWLQALVFSLAFIILVLSFFGRSVTVSGDSMLPTLHHSDHLFLQSRAFHIDQGDIVVIHNAFAPEAHYDKSIVKRVIAVGGQSVVIDYDANQILVDGTALDEPYINEEMLPPSTNSYQTITEAVVPEGYIFVLGDNRNHSSDSRDERIALVDTRNVLGRAVFIATPISHFTIF